VSSTVNSIAQTRSIIVLLNLSAIPFVVDIIGQLHPTKSLDPGNISPYREVLFQNQFEELDFLLMK
jgi:hypothetical protein